MLEKAAKEAPTPVLAGMEHLVGPLETTLTTRLRGDPVKQEVREGASTCALRSGACPGAPLAGDCAHHAVRL